MPGYASGSPSRDVPIKITPPNALAKAAMSFAISAWLLSGYVFLKSIE